MRSGESGMAFHPIHVFSGTNNHLCSLIIPHQFIPFFILCLDILGNPDHEHLDEDLVSLTWVCNYVDMVADGRVELKPVITIMKSMVNACQQAKMDQALR